MSTPVIITDAEASDAAGIAAIWNPIIRETAITFTSEEKTPEAVAAMIAERRRSDFPFLVARQGEGLLGFATYTQFRGGVGYARTMEHSIILSPTARGQGVGARFMSVIEDHARRRGVGSLFGGVSSANSAGVRFHERQGYVQVALLKAVGYKFDQWFDLHLMQKRLIAPDNPDKAP